tara:strand:- start:159 stop:272 length:114 start_codon:yes stop_codon:yes gene_type:complete
MIEYIKAHVFAKQANFSQIQPTHTKAFIFPAFRDELE